MQRDTQVPLSLQSPPKQIMQRNQMHARRDEIVAALIGYCGAWVFAAAISLGANT